jgi:adenine-specific DNA-methyltransferase
MRRLPPSVRSPDPTRLLFHEAGPTQLVQVPVYGRLGDVSQLRDEMGLGPRPIDEGEQQPHGQRIERVSEMCSPGVHLLCIPRIVVAGAKVTPPTPLAGVEAPKLFQMPALATATAAGTAVEIEARGRLVAAHVARYPRIRFMGSKYRLAPRLAEVFDELPEGPALDGFSGSGVVGYTLKALNRSVTANDHLAFAAALTRALVENSSEVLSDDDVARLCSGNKDGRSFIAETFAGLYFPDEDHAFLDAAWSHLDDLEGAKRALAISSLCLAAAWKQPRGVFTITTPRYDDGRRQMKMSLQELFCEAARNFNDAVFCSTGGPCRSTCGDIFDVDPSEFAVAYLDPPYAPPRDDTCYIKRYHFLEGLATYWRGQEIMWETKTRKLQKRQTPFASKKTVRAALDRLFAHFGNCALVVSYGSNAAVDATELEQILRRHKREVMRHEITHRYAFGTHTKATRRAATEYIFVAT